MMDLIIVTQAHGSCGYGVTEDELLNGNSNSIARLKQSRQRTLHDFWDGCQSQNDGSQEQIKRMRITDCSENPNIEGASATQNAANVKRDGFSELESAADDIEFMNSVSWETIEAEAILSLSRRSTPSRIPSRIRWRQIMFQKRIFSDDSFGNLYYFLSFFSEICSFLSSLTFSNVVFTAALLVFLHFVSLPLLFVQLFPSM